MSTPTPTSTSDSDALSLIRHDLNCLTDPNKNTRKKAIQQLTTCIQQAQKATSTSASSSSTLPIPLILTTIIPAVLTRMADPIEQIRIAAITLITDVITQFGLGSSNDLFTQLVSSLQTRLANTSQAENEPAEEVRLQLLQLLHVTLQQQIKVQDNTPSLSESQSQVDNSLTHVVTILTKAVTDPYPDAKKESCTCIAATCTLLSRCALPPTTRTGHFSSLTRAVCVPLKHQHSAVRVSSLEACAAVVSHSCISGFTAEFTEHVWPLLQAAQSDRTARVREVLIQISVQWMKDLTNITASQFSQLARILIAGTSDTQPNIQELAITQLESVAVIMESRRAANTAVTGANSTPQPMETTSDNNTELDAWLPPDVAQPFTARPSLAVRNLVCSLLSHLLPPTLTDVTDWTAATRARAAGTLHSLLLLAEGSSLLVSHVPAVVTVLFRTIKDDEPLVQTQMVSCARILGRFVSPDAYLASILPALQGGRDTGGRAPCLCVLAHLIHGARGSARAQHALESHLNTILNTIRQCELDDVEVRVWMHHIVRNALQATPKICTSSPLNGQLFLFLLQLDAKATSTTEQQQALESIALFGSAEHHLNTPPTTSATTSFPSVSWQAVYSTHFWSAFQALTSDPNTNYAEKDSLSGSMLFRLLERSLDAVHQHIQYVLPIWVSCSDPNRDPSVRVHILSCVHAFIVHHSTQQRSFTSTTSSSLDQDTLQQIIIGVLIPSCVWRAGRGAAAIRLHAIVCLQLCVDTLELHVQTIKTIAPHLLPVLRSCSDDDSAQLRLCVARIFKQLFILGLGSQECAMEDDTVTDTYRDLMKRWDDSDDEIRIEVMSTMSVFITKAFPPAASYDVNTTHFSYLIKTALIYLDDPNPQVQSATYDFVRAVTPYNPRVVIQQLQSGRGSSSSSSPRFYEPLLQHAQSLAAGSS